MSRIALPIASALAMTVVLAASAPAEEKASPATTVRAKSILGAKVALKGGTSAGTVEDIVLSNEGVVDYLVVSSGGKYVTVPWDAARFDYNKRMATIELTQEQYQKIPTYTSEAYPNYYSPEYRTQTYKYYGLTPGRERRLERRIERRP
jgi:hypothetical protein